MGIYDQLKKADLSAFENKPFLVEGGKEPYYAVCCTPAELLTVQQYAAMGTIGAVILEVFARCFVDADGAQVFAGKDPVLQINSAIDQQILTLEVVSLVTQKVMAETAKKYSPLQPSPKRQPQQATQKPKAKKRV